MSASAKLTNSTDEVRFAGLFQGDNIFAIPYFQRQYKWQKPKLRQLQADILQVVDGESDVHFLGAIITYLRPKSNSSQPSFYDVIDGQQRLTTVYLYLCAVVDKLIELGELGEAKQIFLKYIVARDLESDQGSNLRLHPSHEDRRALNAVVEGLMVDKTFRDSLGFELTPLPAPPGPKKDSAITANFKAASRFLAAQYGSGGLDQVREIIEVLVAGLTVVEIQVQDPTSGPSIFDSLNSRQQPMTIGDLVRNHIFASASEKNPAAVEQIHQAKWLPFYHQFNHSGKNYFDQYFFPYALTQDPTVTTSRAYPRLVQLWGALGAEEKIENLAGLQPHFMDIAAGTQNLAGHEAPIADRIARLHQGRAPSSVYPFVMLLSRSVSEGADPKQAAQVLDLLEAFLTRRQIAGIEPTGLHAVFKGLWSEVEHDVSPAAVFKAMRRHKTVLWPDDSEVEDAIRTRAMYKANICSYLVREYDRSRGGDLHTTPSQIEHVLPRNPAAGDWGEFSTSDHAQMHHRLANLIPLSQQMNPSIGNGPYTKKREVYEKDSVFKSAREFADDYATWTPADLLKRESVLVGWALARWPDPIKASVEEGLGPTVSTAG